MLLVGKKAPSFSAPAVINGNQIVEDFSLEQYIGELHHVEAHGEVCPANWQQGREAMAATKEGIANYLSNN